MKAPAEEFAEAVERLIGLCEEETRADDAPEQLYRALTQLIVLAPCLSEDCADHGPYDDGTEVAETQYRRVYEKAASLVETQFYDCTWPDGEVTTADTADDLADIYRDLKPGLLLWKRGREEDRRGAVWAWRIGHRAHWGAHASGLHDVLKSQVRKEGIDDVPLLGGEPEFFKAVLSRRPDWAPYLSRLPANPDNLWTAQLEVSSPTGEPALNFAIWFEHGAPSISFGPWHTHTQSLEDLWSYIEAIEAGLLVLITNLGGHYDGRTYELDLRNEDALLDYMTDEDAPPKARIRTFTGAGDCEHP